MADGLCELLQNLSSSIQHLESSEEATKQGAVLPILKYLDWDVNDVEQVRPEFPVGKGADRIDYCLQAGRRRVFVEAKRAGCDLDSHQDQLLDYSFRHGVELAVLTTGITWWLYLPLKPGDWRERRFAEIDTSEVSSAADRLRTFLNRERVADGSAIQSARVAVIENVLPLAWKTVCAEHLGSLLPWLDEEVHGLSGYEPNRELLEAYIARASGSVPIGNSASGTLASGALPKQETKQTGPSARVSAESKAVQAEKILREKADWYPVARLRKDIGTLTLSYVLKQRPEQFELKRTAISTWSA
jgi:predicted type IV restriction endonuclease